MRGTRGTAWKRFLKKGEGVGARQLAKLGRGLGVLSTVFIAFDARRGFAGEGHHPHLDGVTGAADEAIYQMMFGPTVEGALGTVGAYYDESYSTRSKAIQHNRFNSVRDDPAISAFLKGQKVDGGQLYRQQNTPQTDGHDPSLWERFKNYLWGD